jgi:hypothetical protein
MKTVPLQVVSAVMSAEATVPTVAVTPLQLLTISPTVAASTWPADAELEPACPVGPPPAPSARGSAPSLFWKQAGAKPSNEMVHKAARGEREWDRMVSSYGVAE